MRVSEENANKDTKKMKNKIHSCWKLGERMIQTDFLHMKIDTHKKKREEPNKIHWDCVELVGKEVLLHRLYAALHPRQSVLWEKGRGRGRGGRVQTITVSYMALLRYSNYAQFNGLLFLHTLFLFCMLTISLLVLPPPPLASHCVESTQTSSSSTCIFVLLCADASFSPFSQCFPYNM